MLLVNPTIIYTKFNEHDTPRNCPVAAICSFSPAAGDNSKPDFGLRLLAWSPETLPRSGGGNSASSAAGMSMRTLEPEDDVDNIVGGSSD